MAAFTLASDKIPPFLQDYLYRTDPTGQLVSNNANLPSEQAGKTDLQFLTFSISGVPRFDTTDSACQYYKAISGVTGVTGCGPNGALQGSDIVTFEK
ncbi:MAG TPA: hypothetical protein VE690_13450 [Rhodopila sp.]|nr:hypothetical protein [Rhodopila sp.]